MLGPDGRPRSDIFVDDNLHMNRNGYEIWRDSIRPLLMKNEARYKQSGDARLSGGIFSLLAYGSGCAEAEAGRESRAQG